MFEAWWRENRTRLITIYNEEISLDMAIMMIAEMVWESALNGKTKAKIDQG